MADRNPLGVHALVWTGTWDEAAVDAACAGTAKAGYDLLEVPLLNPADVDPDMTTRVLAAHGLRPTCSLGLDFDTDISSTDREVVERGASLLHAAVDVAGAIGSAYVGGPIYSAMAKYTSAPSDAGRANSVAVLRDVADAAADRGITLGLEPVNRYESNLLNTVAQTLDHLAAIDRDNVVVHLDTYHANIEERDVAGALRSASDSGQLGYLHIGESNRGYLGTGTIAWEPFFDTLRGIDFPGPVVFESFSSAVVSDRFAAALGVWRDLWSDSADLAQHAFDFITDALQEEDR